MNTTFDKSKRIFISYAHDKNADIVNRIRDYLLDFGYDVWIDNSQIHTGDDWRHKITDGLLESNGVIAFLSKHAVRRPNGVCLDELHIARCIKRMEILTVLMETEEEVSPPASLCDRQWMDMSDWKEKFGTDEWDAYFDERIEELVTSIESDRFSRFCGEIETLREFLKPLDNDSKAQRLLKNKFIGREDLMGKVHAWLDAGDESQSVLVLYGNPGSGKSAFAANLTQYDPDVLTDLFFEWDSNMLQNENQVIRTLAFRLAAVLPDYRSILCKKIAEDLDWQKDEFFIKYMGSDLLDVLITNPLSYCIEGSRAPKIIVLDGLDETSDRVLSVIAKMCASLPKWIKVLITSREAEPINAHFASAAQLVIEDDAGNNLEDVNAYLKERLDVDEKMLHDLSEKSEGNFQYAVLLCDALDCGRITIDDAMFIPDGINDFYTMQFKRFYPDLDNFKEERSIWELLMADPPIPMELIRVCLDIEEYNFADFIGKVSGSILLKSEISLEQGSRKTCPALFFSHRSVPEWLTDQALAGSYFINPERGAERLANFAMETANCSCYESGMDYDLYDYVIRNKARWLSEAGMWEKLEQLLLNSYEPEVLEAFFEPWTGFWPSTPDYALLQRSLGDIWSYADTFPEDYPMERIREKLVEILCFFIEKNGGFSLAKQPYWVRSLYAMYFLLSTCMRRGTFADVFFASFDGLRVDEYFKSRASDEGDSRGRYDRCWTARWIRSAYETCKSNHVVIPKRVESICEGIKDAIYY